MRTRTKALALLQNVIGDCRRCGLHEGRQNIVFGTGHSDASLMFVGEGPGEDEDRLGEPFVGRAGQLLTRMIEAMGFSRDTVYIANIVKCRAKTAAGENRMPSPEEAATCAPFVRHQIAAIEPLVIVTLGNLATRTLLGIEDGITSIRGKWRSYQGPNGNIAVMPTFHPSFLLRNQAGKPYVWRDLRAVVEHLRENGVSPPHERIEPHPIWSGDRRPSRRPSP